MDKQLEQNVKDLEEARALRALNNDITDLVEKYGNTKIDPDAMGGAFLVAGTKVINAHCHALVEYARYSVGIEQAMKGGQDESAE